MPSLDDIRRRLRAAQPTPSVVVNVQRFKHDWRSARISGQQFETDVTASVYETSIVDSKFTLEALFTGEHNTISSCFFGEKLTIIGDNFNFLDTIFNGPVRYQGDSIAFTGCHFKSGGPEPISGAPEASRFVSNGCIVDRPIDHIVQTFELSLHTAPPTPREPCEAKHNGYKRIKAKLTRVRGEGAAGKLAWWTNDDELSFPQCTGGDETITHLVARPVGFDSDDDAKAIKLPFPVLIFVGKTFVIDKNALEFEL